MAIGTDELCRAEDEGEAHLDEGGEEENQEVCEEDAQLVGVGVTGFLKHLLNGQCVLVKQASLRNPDWTGALAFV